MCRIVQLPYFSMVFMLKNIGIVGIYKKNFKNTFGLVLALTETRVKPFEV